MISVLSDGHAGAHAAIDNFITDLQKVLAGRRLFKRVRVRASSASLALALPEELARDMGQVCVGPLASSTCMHASTFTVQRTQTGLSPVHLDLPVDKQDVHSPLLFPPGGLLAAGNAPRFPPIAPPAAGGLAGTLTGIGPLPPAWPKSALGLCPKLGRWPLGGACGGKGGGGA